MNKLCLKINYILVYADRWISNKKSVNVKITTSYVKFYELRKVTLFMQKNGKLCRNMQNERYKFVYNKQA